MSHQARASVLRRQQEFIMTDLVTLAGANGTAARWTNHPSPKLHIQAGCTACPKR